MKIKVKNILWDRRDSYFFEIPEFNLYEGDEVKVKWIKPEELAISTGRKEFPFRVIQRANIVELDGKPYKFTLSGRKDNVRIVKGSRGNSYTVTGNHKCTCPGFTFRGSCKHLAA